MYYDFLILNNWIICISLQEKHVYINQVNLCRRMKKNLNFKFVKIFCNWYGSNLYLRSFISVDWKRAVSSFFVWTCCIYRFVVPAASVSLAAPMKDGDDDVRHVVNPCIPKLCILRIDSISIQKLVFHSYLILCTNSFVG